MRKTAPLEIKIIALLMIWFSLFDLWTSITFMHGFRHLFLPRLLLPFVIIVAACGLWNLKNWARILAASLFAITTIFSLMVFLPYLSGMQTSGLPPGEITITNIFFVALNVLPYALIFFYLCSSAVRQCFKPELELGQYSPTPSTRIKTIARLGIVLMTSQPFVDKMIIRRRGPGATALREERINNAASQSVPGRINTNL